VERGRVFFLSLNNVLGSYSATQYIGNHCSYLTPSCIFRASAVGAILWFFIKFSLNIGKGTIIG